MEKEQAADLVRRNPAGIMTILWNGRQHCFGYHDTATGQSGTSHKPLEPRHWYRHIKHDSSWGLGRHPLMVDGRCFWGCLDLDQPGLTDEQASAIVATSRANHVPLLWAFSKSRGLHGFLFLAEPVPAAELRRLLYVWGTAVFGWSLLTGEKGPGKFEIFPKADVVTPKAPFQGGWLNLPFHRGGAVTSRYGIGTKGRVSMQGWLTAALSRRLTAEKFAEYVAGCPTDAHIVQLLKSTEGTGREDMEPGDYHHDPTTTGLMLKIDVGQRNETVFKSLCAAWRWGWSMEALEALCDEQYPCIPQGRGEPYRCEEMQGALRQVAKHPQDFDLHDSDAMTRAAIRDLQRVGWSDEAITAACAAEGID